MGNPVSLFLLQMPGKSHALASNYYVERFSTSPLFDPHCSQIILFRSTRESYRSSEFASQILVKHGFKVAFKVSSWILDTQCASCLGRNLFKSDHWVLDERRLLYETQQAYFYGLSAPAAIAAVTSTPAELLGLDHRIGFVKSGILQVESNTTDEFTKISFILTGWDAGQYSS